MVKRFSVSVSDELGERFEPFKEKLSPSSIFQKALETAVEREERFSQSLKGDVDMGAIVERLKAEKSNTEQEMHECGREEGLKWVKQLHYQDLVAAVNFEPPMFLHHMIDFSDGNADRDSIQYVLWEFLEAHPEYTPNDDSHLPEEAQQYVWGILDAVSDFWDEVSPQLS